MSIVLVAPGKKNLSEWQTGLHSYVKAQGIECPVSIWPEVNNFEEVSMAITWKHPPGSLQQFPNLKLIGSMGAGVDHIFADQSLKPTLKIVRVVSEALAISMSQYVVGHILALQKQFSYFRQKQREGVWAYTDEPEKNLQVGIMGMGALGKHAAQTLSSLGIPVTGFAQKAKAKPVNTYGQSDLDLFLSEVNVLVILMPLTPATRAMVNREFFNRCRPGTVLINVARGPILVEEDLLEALETRVISSAILDVFNTEPLPKTHPFWKHPRITITPHISSVTKINAAIPQLGQNYINLLSNKPLINEVNPKRFY